MCIRTHSFLGCIYFFNSKKRATVKESFQGMEGQDQPLPVYQLLASSAWPQGCRWWQLLLEHGSLTTRNQSSEHNYAFFMNSQKARNICDIHTQVHVYTIIYTYVYTHIYVLTLLLVLQRVYNHWNITNFSTNSRSSVSNKPSILGLSLVQDTVSATYQQSLWNGEGILSSVKQNTVSSKPVAKKRNTPLGSFLFSFIHSENMYWTWILHEYA